MKNTYNLETILKQWATTKFKNKVVLCIQDETDININTFDMEQEALDYLDEEFGSESNSDDFYMFDLREGTQTKKREFKRKDKVIVIGGKYQGKRGTFKGSYFDGEHVSLGNAKVLIEDIDEDEIYVDEIPTHFLDLDE